MKSMVYKATYNWRCTSFWWTLMISPSQNSEEKYDFSSQTNDGIDIWLVVWNIFPYIGNNDPNWLIFFRGIETTYQYLIGTTIGICALLFFQSLSKRCVVAVMATQNRPPKRPNMWLCQVLCPSTSTSMYHCLLLFVAAVDCLLVYV